MVTSLIDITQGVADQGTVIDGIADLQVDGAITVGLMTGAEKGETGKHNPKYWFHRRWICFAKIVVFFRIWLSLQQNSCYL